MSPRSAVVLVDTNVFGADLVRRGAPIATLYRPLLEGRSFVLSFHPPGWGTRRLDRLDDAWLGPMWCGPVPSCSMHTSTCVCAAKKVGHALAQSHHDADRWIAAMAIRLGIPLVSHDSVFKGAPGLMLERYSA